MNIILRTLAHFFGAVSIGFGLNACFNHVPALSFFELPAPTTAEGKLLLEVMSPVYGARDIFMGFAIFVTALCDNRLALGWITMAVGAVAGVDGAVCKWSVGAGEMNHWGYAPIMVILGAAILVWGDDGKEEKVKRERKRV